MNVLDRIVRVDLWHHLRVRHVLQGSGVGVGVSDLGRLNTVEHVGAVILGILVVARIFVTCDVLLVALAIVAFHVTLVRCLLSWHLRREKRCNYERMDRNQQMENKL